MSGRRALTLFNSSIAILCMSLGFWHQASAGDLSLILNGKAVHMEVPAGHKYNEENWGVGLHYEFLDARDKWLPFVHGSEFLDSNSNVSYYFGGGVLRRFALSSEPSTARVDVGFVAFLMHREEYRSGRLFPGILPVISVGNDVLAVNVTYVPKVAPKMSPLFFFQLKVGLSWLK